ncbi:hypothetical protein [Alkalicoccobacillus porphyridii]|uniref:Uncharacterized protein n=1 Tax=Alkalicoccobacillus porphyridii TaxID=2597270 RepID=A0A553ZV49_9BACI|nr:hypothetical protein [Alkalicoccobacillus porphyridii]TSB45205.1 hypothetical protein FN960_17215 [Alkalicoccobacillus porphyridii]
MNLYKAHIIHPHTNVPLIVYFNESDGFVSFERDEKVLQAIYSMKSDLMQSKSFQASLKRASHLCQTQYPLDTMEEVQEFLSKIGLDLKDIEFEQVYVH